MSKMMRWLRGVENSYINKETKRMDDSREVIKTIVDEWLTREATPGRCPNCGSTHVTEYMNGNFGEGGDYAFSSCDECEYEFEFDDGRNEEDE